MDRVKEKKQPESPVYICSECGREISGAHVYIKKDDGRSCTFTSDACRESVIGTNDIINRTIIEVKEDGT